MSKTTKSDVMSMIMLKRSYQLVSCGNKAELRDSARNNMVVFSGSYKQVYAEAKRRGLTY